MSQNQMRNFEIETLKDSKGAKSPPKSQQNKPMKKYNNAPPKSFFKKYNYFDLPDRRIDANDPDLDLPDNSISTSKYNLITFLPKNLLEQFSKSANLYFLVIGILQMITAISVSGGEPVTLVPLFFIVVVSALKDLIEDLRRKRSDNEENSKKTKVIKSGRPANVKWQHLRVGDIIKIVNNQYFPCDVLLIGTKDPKGVVYVETKNLDGETNLKHKVVHKDIKKELSTEEKILNAKFTLLYEKPNPYLYNFTGTAVIDENKIPCDNNNFILRGCSLKNSEWAYGLVAYTGHHTKIMLNSVNAKPKKSRLEIKMNRKINLIFIILLAICLAAGLVYVIWMHSNTDIIPYLGYTESNFIIEALTRFGNWILIFSNIVPISLLVTLEMVKVAQGLFISNDPQMKQASTNINAAVQSSSLNEELGQIHYIFSDKTGTLTQNLMEFKKISVNGKEYGNNRDYDISGCPQVENVDFQDKNFFEAVNQKAHPENKAAHNFLKFLAICHTVIAQKDGKNVVYNASSPDEFALINYAKFMGYEYQGTDEENRILIKVKDRVFKYKLLYVLEFSSARKRMSIIFKDDDGTLRLYCKGADSIINKRIKNQTPALTSTMQNLEDFASEGLRTLLLAERVITNDEFRRWTEKYSAASTSLADREAKMESVQDEIEQGLALVGATAIEDKLQDEVGETIGLLKEAGIKVWVLTGDKVETAINVAFSCNLITNAYKQLIIDGTDTAVVGEAIESAKKNLSTHAKNAVIITGDALIHAMRKNLSSKLMEVLEKCEAVVCCRVSPKQKQEVVGLVRKEKPSCITLAIGDGANDVNMIVGAHVGVGLKGVEGHQAARASDYSFAEFKFLKNLVFVHGRECYRRNSYLILYNFYKNISIVGPDLWYGFINIFSGQSMFDANLFQLYNIFFTSLPIIIYAVFDREFKDETLLNNPFLYTDGQRNKHFTNRKYWMWFVLAFYEAFVFCFVTYTVLGNEAFSSSGYLSYYFADGNLVYFTVVVTVNLKVLLFSNQYSFLLLFTVFGSIAVFLGFNYVFTIISTYQLYGTFSLYYNSLTLINVILPSVLVSIMIHMAVIRFTDLQDKKQDLEKPKAEPIDVDTTLELSLNDDFKQIILKYRGFAFSQEEAGDEGKKKSHKFNPQ